ncbi:hypothetical protein KJ812_05345 [Patescibacteria group bacterium]|nr:hypothetical protein [Patescibacteria group bacterium]MBU4125694.1 hypothetical protein [Patescibacteria group bacterium]
MFKQNFCSSAIDNLQTTEKGYGQIVPPPHTLIAKTQDIENHFVGVAKMIKIAKNTTKISFCAHTQNDKK